MPKSTFTKIDTNDITVQKIQDSLGVIFNNIFKCPFLDGNEVTVSFTQNMDQVISHGLGRNYKGFIPLNQNNFGLIKISDTPNTDQKQKIILQATNSLVTSIWIF